MPLGEVLAPAIAHAIDGYPITQRVAYDFTAAVGHLEGAARAMFTHNGKPLPQGSRHRQPELAATLERIGREGRAAFYEGKIATEIIDTLRERGGLQSQDDFDAARGEYVTPISTTFRGHRVWQCPPNGQGVIALLLLGIMEGIDTFGDDPITAKRIHCEIEAGRLAYRDRAAVLADPAQVDVPVERMLSADYAAELRGQISPTSRIANLPPSPLPPHGGTVYITVVDRERNACSLINTLYAGFGSGIMAPKCGVMLHNRGQGFVVDPDHPNGIAGSKRPLHTIIPGMITKNGKVCMSYGVMGGEYQAFGHMQFLSRFFDYGMDIQTAQDAPRFFPDPFEDFVEVEAPIASDVREALAGLGHDIRTAARPIGGSQAISIDWENDILTGGSDPRKDGFAAGY